MGDDHDPRRLKEHLSRTRCACSPEGDPIPSIVCGLRKGWPVCKQGKHRFESGLSPARVHSPPQKKTFNCRAPFSSLPTETITRREAVKRSIHGRQAQMLIDRAADRSTRAAVFPFLSVSGPFSITTPLFLSLWIDLRW